MDQLEAEVWAWSEGRKLGQYQAEKQITELKKTIHNLHDCIDCILDEKRSVDEGFRATIDQRNQLQSDFKKSRVENIKLGATIMIEALKAESSVSIKQRSRSQN